MKRDGAEPSSLEKSDEMNIMTAKKLPKSFPIKIFFAPKMFPPSQLVANREVAAHATKLWTFFSNSMHDSMHFYSE